MSKKIEKIFQGPNAEELNVLLHITNDVGYVFFVGDKTPKISMTRRLLEELHNLGYKIVKQKEDEK